IDINDDRFYTGDQRLSGFGSLTTGMKLIRDFGDGFSANLSYDFNFTDNGLAIVSPGSPGLKDLYSSLISFGISKSF
ncbi:MAG: hypothetical protein KDD53_10575, partial [Bdellovibrionales bacterium]|nr:hypothetical protein [Bdellovibrionales bacterium]